MDRKLVVTFRAAASARAVSAPDSEDSNGTAGGTSPTPGAPASANRIPPANRGAEWNDDEMSFLQHARALAGEARALGGSIVAFDADRVSFAFEVDEVGASLEAGPDVATAAEHVQGARGANANDVLGFARGGARVPAADAPGWAVGVAIGPLSRFDAPQRDGRSAASSAISAYGDLAWGSALVRASALASRAIPGEILVDDDVVALESDLAPTTDRVGPRHVDTIRVPASECLGDLGRMRVAPFVGALPVANPPSGTFVIVRADPGMGGSRYLFEVALGAPRALSVSPAGSGLEPLGALRRALGRSITRELSPQLLELAAPLEALLDGDGVPIDVAAELVGAFLSPRQSGEPAGVLVIDDVNELDPSSLSACALAVSRPGSRVGALARIGEGAMVPPAIASLVAEAQVGLPPMSRIGAQALAGACAVGSFDPSASRRWARLGGRVPLGIVEAITHGVHTGHIAWTEAERGMPRTRRSGRGRVRPAEEWIRRRAELEHGACRTLLGVVALFGGEARVSRVMRVLERAGHRLGGHAALDELVVRRWFVFTQEDWIALPSRTHVRALARLLDLQDRQAIHRAAADVFEEEEGAIGRAEAAWHAAEAGDDERASEIALGCARTALSLGMDASTTQLTVFGRAADPSRAIGTVAKGALLDGENAAVERWIHGLCASGGRTTFTERLLAVARMRRGELGDALRVLRHTRASLDAKSYGLRCQTSLALGVALSVAGRPDEALVEAMDALARAREGRDSRGEQASLAFLAKLYASMGRPEATRLLEHSRR